MNNLISPPPNAFNSGKTEIGIFVVVRLLQYSTPDAPFLIGSTHRRLWVECIEATATASFLKREEKLPYIRLATRKLDTLKFFLLILWETGSLLDKRYLALSVKVDEIGKMLGGWYGQLQKQNSPGGREMK